MKFKYCAIAAALAGSLFAASASAAPLATTSFWFDADGTSGPANAVFVKFYLDISGTYTATNTYGSPNPLAYTFTQTGSEGVTGADGKLAGGLSGMINTWGDNHVQCCKCYATFTGAGTGLLGSGAVTFTSGNIDLYSGLSASPFASFTITGGSAQTDNEGLPTANGQSTLVGLATSISSGYFFLDNAGAPGQDFAAVLADDPPHLWLCHHQCARDQCR